MQMIRKTGILLLFILCIHTAFTQSHTIQQSIKFSNHLINNKLYNDCSLLLRQSLNYPYLSNDQKDTVFFKLGEVYFKKNEHDSALFSFNAVSKSSTLFEESRFCKSYILSFEQKYTESLLVLNEMNNVDSTSKLLYSAGISLLIRDTSQFRRISNDFVKNTKEYGVAQDNLTTLYSEIKKTKHKSGFLAGAMSAFIPGAGKVYAGKTRQGITTFLPVAIMGAQVYEAYKVGGIKSGRFIFYGSLFSIFYIGNIWGSVLSVSVTRNEINKEINDQILFNMRIPVQVLFR